MQSNKKFILFIDDGDVEQYLMDVTINMNFNDKYCLLQAQNQEQAENLFAKHKDRIFLCIVDLMLKKKSGYDVFKNLRRSYPAFTKNIGVLFCSAYSDKLRRIKSHHDQAGDTNIEILPKPYNANMLIKYVNNFAMRFSG